MDKKLGMTLKAMTEDPGLSDGIRGIIEGEADQTHDEALSSSSVEAQGRKY